MKQEDTSVEDASERYRWVHRVIHKLCMQVQREFLRRSAEAFAGVWIRIAAGVTGERSAGVGEEALCCSERLLRRVVRAFRENGEKKCASIPVGGAPYPDKKERGAFRAMVYTPLPVLWMADRKRRFPNTDCCDWWSVENRP